MISESPKKKKIKGQMLTEADAEPNALARMFSSLSSLGLYAAGGAAVVGFFAYNQYSSWSGGTRSYSSSPTAAEDDGVGRTGVEVASPMAVSETAAARKIPTERMTRRRMAEITPHVTM